LAGIRVARCRLALVSAFIDLKGASYHRQGRDHRARGRGYRGPAERQLPHPARQRPRDARLRRRQDAPLSHPHQPGRPHQDPALPVRPQPRSYRLPLQV